MSPPPPVNQWMTFPSGQPLLPSDFAITSETVTKNARWQLNLEQQLTQFHEMFIHYKARVAQFTSEELSVIYHMDELYMLFSRKFNKFCQYDEERKKEVLGGLQSNINAVLSQLSPESKKKLSVQEQ